MFELRVIDEIKRGVFIVLRLFIDDNVTLSKKMNMKVFYCVHSSSFVDRVK